MTEKFLNVDTRVVLGADVGKASIVVKRLVGNTPTKGGTITIKNDPVSIATALAQIGHIDLIICEVTGGYERALLNTAWQAKLPIHRADGARVKAYIKSNGVRAKNDSIDALWLAVYGQDRFDKLKNWSPPAQEDERFQALVQHRQALLKAQTVVKNRRKAPTCDHIVAFLDDELDFYVKQIKAVEDEIEALLALNTMIADKEKKLRNIKGIGPVSARILIAMLPELGKVTRRQIASLAGLAPHPDQSGITTKKRPMTGGRDLVRSTLFLAALSAAKHHPTLKLFYDNLIANLKPAKKALAAIARKLVTIANAVLRPEKTPECALLKLT
jgi:transposase